MGAELEEIRKKEEEREEKDRMWEDRWKNAKERETDLLHNVGELEHLLRANEQNKVDAHTFRTLRLDKMSA